MKPKRTINSNFTFVLQDGNEDNDLWVEKALEEGFPCSKSVWVPTQEERERIAAGENIELIVWGEGHPAVAMDVTDIELKGAPVE